MLKGYLTLIFTMGFSFAVSFCAGCGTAWVAGKPMLVGAGSGLLLGASAMTVLFVKSPLTKGMVVVQPNVLPSASPDLAVVEKK
jgi:hypothetical protein